MAIVMNVVVTFIPFMHNLFTLGEGGGGWEVTKL